MQLQNLKAKGLIVEELPTKAEIQAPQPAAIHGLARTTARTLARTQAFGVSPEAVAEPAPDMTQPQYSLAIAHVLLQDLPRRYAIAVS